MSRIGTRFGIRTATIAAAAGGLGTAFLALTPTASADPVAPVLPALPGGVNMIQQLANAPALASQLLQSASTMLQPITATPASTGTYPGAIPASSPLGTQAPVSAPMNSMVGTVPSMPTSSIPLLSQLGLPSNLSSLPLPNLGGAAATPAAPAVGAPALPPSLNPFSALP